MRGNGKNTRRKNQTFGKVEKQSIMFQRAEKSTNTASHVAVSTINIFNVCLSFNSPNNIFTFDACPFHTFSKRKWLHGRRAQGYLNTFYIIYQNYYK
jgi:hypothetical protein